MSWETEARCAARATNRRRGRRPRRLRALAARGRAGTAVPAMRRLRAGRSGSPRETCVLWRRPSSRAAGSGSRPSSATARRTTWSCSARRPTSFMTPPATAPRWRRRRARSCSPRSIPRSGRSAAGCVADGGHGRGPLHRPGGGGAVRGGRDGRGGGRSRAARRPLLRRPRDVRLARRHRPRADADRGRGARGAGGRERHRARPGDARRNVVTRGVDLNALAGRRFAIGEVEIAGRRWCEPCAVLQRLTTPGVLRGLVHRGGLRADILGGGTIARGDAVRPL